MKTKHGILALLVALCLLIGLLPGTVLAASTVASGTSGGNITWVLDSDGVLTISGESDIGEAPTWIFYGYAEKVKTVIIEEGITGIGFSAFDGCTNLSSISIPNTVTYIDGQAFAHCSSLTNITIPESVTSIWGGSFLGCSSLTSIVIPASVTSVASGAFQGCTSLTAIEVDSDNEAYCSQDGVLFNKEMTELIACPSGKTGAYVIPASVTSVGSSAFSGCTGLTSISIPDSVTSIGDRAFEDCTSLTSISIPDSVTSIGDWAFYNCTGLTAIEVDPSNAYYSSLDGVLFNKDMTELLLYPNAKAGAYVIPDGITDIGTVFSGHEYLTAISIPDSVTSIRARAFDGCTGLESIIVSESNTDYCSVDGVLFSKDLTELLLYPDGKSGEYAIPDGTLIINDYAFSGCTKLTGVTIPNSVKGLYVYAFSGCTGLTSVTIGSGISIIGSSAFEGCTGLTSVSIPDSVTSIYSAAFKDCTSLTSIVIPDSVTVIGNMAFYGCTGLTSVSIPDSVTKIYGSAFVGCSNLAEINVDADNEIYCSLDGVLFNKDMTELIEYPAGKAGAYTLPDSVTDIGYVFCDNTALTSITLGKCAANVTIFSFSGCANLQAIYVDGENEDYCSVDGVLFSKDMTTLIRYPYAKAGDYTIPEGVITIGYSAFRGCTGLTGVTIPDSVTDIDGSAFSDCTGLTGVTIPDSVTSIGDSAFYNCVNLAYVTLPDSITEIASQTFYNCDSLTCITIPASVTYLGFKAFTFCDNLKTIIFTGNAPETYCPFSELNEMSYGIVNITATAYYPAGDETWTEEAMESAYGDITWVAYTPGETAEVTASVSVGDGAPSASASVPVSTLDETLASIGVEVSYDLSVNVAENISEDEKALIEAALDGNTAAMYLDVTLNRTVGGDTAAVTETEEMVTITFTIPEELLGENRTYSVIRVHDGEVEILPDLDNDANTVTIQTDRFSTYVLTYSETTNEPTAPATSEPEASTPTGDNPKDGDFAPIMTCAVLMLLSAAAVVNIRKRVF